MLRVWRLFSYMLILLALAGGISLAKEGAFASVKRHTLKELRDQYLIRQKLDYSCGAAALATLMTYYFGDETSEKEILDQLNKLLENLTKEEWAHKKRIGFSLLDLKRVAKQEGYRAAGFKITPEQLRQLAAPVIVYLRPFGYHHFAVLRGVAGGRVYIADPGRGNLRMSAGRFLDEWLLDEGSGIIFVLGRSGEEDITRYLLQLARPSDYPQPRLRSIGYLTSRASTLSTRFSMQARPQ